MPAIYTPCEVKDEDSVRERQKNLYMAVMSTEETAYTLGAAIAECRKQLTALDTRVEDLKTEYRALKGLTR